MASEQCTLTIVRHGQTSANIDGVWHGSTNTPLTDHGHRQAAAVGAHIASHHGPISHVYTSPLDRAHHTSRAIAGNLGLDPIIVPSLVEFDLGSWEGLSFRELFEERKLFQNMSTDPHYAPHGGESPLQVGERLSGALRDIASQHAGERVVVVTHGGALSIALGVLLDNNYASWDRMMKNCAISEPLFDPDPRLVHFNLTDHLPDEAADTH